MMKKLNYVADLSTPPLINRYVLEFGLSGDIYQLPIIHPQTIFPEDTSEEYIIKIIKTCDNVLEAFEKLISSDCINTDTLLDISDFDYCGEDYDIVLSNICEFHRDGWQGIDIPFNKYTMYYYDKKGYRFIVTQKS
jgi:hypothetical protein